MVREEDLPPVRFTLKEKQCIGESRAIFICSNCDGEYDTLKVVKM